MPQKKKATKAPEQPRHTQGLAASIHDLTLRDGRKLTEVIGGNIVGTPQLTRSIEGSSSIELQIYDPGLRWLEKSLSAEKWDCEIDGLWFRYLGTKKSGATMTLTFEDREVAILREFLGPVKAYAHRGQPNELTLAGFLCGLVEKALPGTPIVCPQLEEPQPIETERQAKTAAKEAPTKRAPGIGDTKGLTVKGRAPTPHQTALLGQALDIAASRPCPFVCKVAVVAALIDETDAGMVDGNNVLEALEPYTQIRPAAEEISGFLFGTPTWTGVTAVGYHNAHPEANAYEIAQAVQKSGAGESSNGAANYGQFVDEAREWVEAHGGGTESELEAGGTRTETLPRSFEVKAKGGRKGGPEDFWEAIQRYAKAVNWRAFFSAGVYYYISEDELSRGAVRLAITRKPGQRHPENQQVEDVDFDVNGNKPVKECTITAFAKRWGTPPGAVATVAGYGPASIGPGDAPPKKGETVTVGGKSYRAPELSSAVKASTHEGKGRYLAAKITVPLIGDPAVRKATISARKPTDPLPEGASETRTVSNGDGTVSGGGVWPPKVQAIVDYIDASSAAETDYEWAGGHASFAAPEDDKDCSGFVSGAVHAADYLSTPLTSESFATVFDQGEGEWITVYGNAEHVFMKVKYPDGHWRWAGTGGSPAGGCWVERDNPTSGEPSESDKVASHPPGL